MRNLVKGLRRNRLIVAFFTAFLVAVPVVFATPSTIDTREQLNEWMMHYYQHPQPDITVSAIEFMSREGTLSKAAAQPPIAAFLAQVFAQNPEKVQGWQTRLSAGGEDESRMMALAFWISGNEPLLKAMAGGPSASVAEYAKKLLSDRAPDLLKDEITNAGFLDMLWGSFFATGDEQYVLRIISAVPLAKTEGDVTKMLIGGAARWSLTSNAVQHPKVMEICEAELKRLPDDQKPALQEVIKTAREKKP
jgi:hypothetical protein